MIPSSIVVIYSFCMFVCMCVSICIKSLFLIWTGVNNLMCLHVWALYTWVLFRWSFGLNAPDPCMHYCVQYLPIWGRMSLELVFTFTHINVMRTLQPIYVCEGKSEKARCIHVWETSDIGSLAVGHLCFLKAMSKVLKCFQVIWTT